MKRGKKAQFYLIAALIIIFVIIGFFVINNYANKKEQNIKIYDIAKELKIETGEVYDFGIFNNQDLPSLVENWTDLYYEYLSKTGNAEEWVFVYEDKSSNKLTGILYSTKKEGSISINTGGRDIGIEITGRDKRKVRDIELPTQSDRRVRVNFKNFTYSFKLMEGQNFYFVIRKGGYVAEK